MQNAQNQMYQEQYQQSSGGFGKTLVNFAAMNYMYQQLDGVFDAVQNFGVKDYTFVSKLPFSGLLSTNNPIEATSKNGVFTLSSNLGRTMGDRNVSVSNIIRNIERGESGILDLLKNNDLDPSAIEQIMNSKSKSLGEFSRRKLDYNSSIIQKISNIEMEHGSKQAIEEGAEILARKHGLDEAKAKLLKENLEHLHGNVDAKQVLVNEIDDGIGLAINVNKLAPKFLRENRYFTGTALRAAGGALSWYLNPITQMMVLPTLSAAKSVVSKKANESVQEYRSQVDEYEFADTSGEVAATRQMNDNNMSTEKQLLQMSFQTGREVNNFMNQALNSQTAGVRPNRYRKRYR